MTKPTTWTDRARRICAVIGVCWLTAMVCYLAKMPVAATWLFYIGCAGGIALIAMMIAAHLRERKR